MSESCVKISNSNLVFFMVVSFQIELYWFPRTLLSLVDVCIELIDGEDESNPREKPEETTTIRDDALRWLTMLRLGGIDGNPVLRGTRRRTTYAYMNSN